MTNRLILTGKGLEVYFRDWQNSLFLGMTILYLLPIWSIQFFPTQDGPSHVYNALIIKEYFNTDRYPLFQQYYNLNLQPMPNWFGHTVMAILMFALDPLIAEKLMLTGYVVLFLYSGRYLIASVDPAKKGLSFILFPFVYNYLLQMGFYNFSYSLGFCLLAIGYWWKHHQQLQIKSAILFNLIIVCCYFSHMVSTVIALLSVAILWLVTIRPTNYQRHLLQIPMLFPSCIFPFWFIFSHGTKSNRAHWASQRLYDYFTRLEVLFSFNRFQIYLGQAIAVCFLLLFLLKILTEKIDWRRRRPRAEKSDGFLLVSLICLILYIYVPDGMSGGGFITHRLSLYPFLILLPWLTLTKWRFVKICGSGLLVLIALVNFVYIIDLYPKLDKDMQEFRAGLAKVAPNSRILPLIFDSRGRCQRIGMFLHAIGYYCAYTGGIEWDNYEANTDYFPVRFKPELNGIRPDLGVIEGRPRDMDVHRHVDIVDFICTWSMPTDSPVQQRIETDYKLVFEQKRTRIYQRRPITSSRSTQELPSGIDN
ncbi:MAG: hypothetical protein QGG39_10550 [Candidatus Poribacteria bacterium]|nr:hypothetical protein [Candidatus Poribacteria bacterium]